MVMYCDDNNDQMAWPNWGNDIGQGWLYKPVSGHAPDPLKTNEYANIEAGLYYKYLNNRTVYYCPLDKTNLVSWQKRRQRISSYIQNGAICGFNGDGKTFKLGAFNPAAYTMWEPEITNYGGTWGSNPGFDASQYPNLDEGIGHRHKKGAVITGFSGHVHFIKFEDFQREQTYNNPGLLWCVPGARPDINERGTARCGPPHPERSCGMQGGHRAMWGWRSSEHSNCSKRSAHYRGCFAADRGQGPYGRAFLVAAAPERRSAREIFPGIGAKVDRSLSEISFDQRRYVLLRGHLLR